jgi:hypothetical protein
MGITRALGVDINNNSNSLSAAEGFTISILFLKRYIPVAP